MQDVAFIFFSGLGFCLCLLPLPVHWRARNVGTLLHILWSAVGCLSFFINSVMWANTTDDKAPIFCDITVKLQIMYAPGMTAASLSIMRRLATIAASRTRTSSHRRRRIDIGVDLGLGLGLPLVIAACSYVVQPHRYDIFEGFGCDASVWHSVPAIMLVYWWPVLLGAISAVYGTIAIVFFLRRRLQFKTLLRESQSGLDTNQYLRLIALASTDLLIGLPLNIAIIVLSAQNARPWIGWDEVHADWYQVLHFSSLVIMNDTTVTVRMMFRWICPILAIIFFVFFGVSEDALREYSKWLQAGRRILRLQGRQENKLPSHRYPTLGSTVNELALDDKRGLDALGSPSVLNRETDSLDPNFVNSNRAAITIEVRKQIV